MSDVSQISAFVSTSTRDRLERYTEAHGLKKGAVIEAALLHHLQALEALPVDVVVPARIVLTPESFEQVVGAVLDPPAPTAAMTKLMAGALLEDPDD